jgi:hypothetical protein
VSTQPTTQPSAPIACTTVYERGPNLLVRFVWWLVIGWWVVLRGVSAAEFTRYVKSTYRVLLTRGLRGSYVSFMDTRTRDQFLSRTEHRAVAGHRAAEGSARYGGEVLAGD